MKKSIKNSILVSGLILSSSLIFSCGGDPTTELTAIIGNHSFDINNPKLLTVNVGTVNQVVASAFSESTDKATMTAKLTQDDTVQTTCTTSYGGLSTPVDSVDVPAGEVVKWSCLGTVDPSVTNEYYFVATYNTKLATKTFTG